MKEDGRACLMVQTEIHKMRLLNLGIKIFNLINFIFHKSGTDVELFI
jgi:hypothetical protein